MFYWTIDAFIKTFVVFLLAIHLLACESEKPPAAFYAIDSLITTQAHSLTRMKAGLFKEALLSGKTDTITYVPADTVAWLNELEVFRRLDIINKPVNKGSYHVDDGLFDPGSNLMVKAFTSLEKLPVVYLKVYYQGNISKPRKIEALYDEANLLYESARLLSLHFHQVGNRTVLTSYSIKGGQKMILADSVTFYISGKVLVD